MERSDAYKYTNNMWKVAKSDKKVIATTTNEEIDALRLENTELKKMLLELRQSVNALVKAEPKAEEPVADETRAEKPKKAAK